MKIKKNIKFNLNYIIIIPMMAKKEKKTWKKFLLRIMPLLTAPFFLTAIGCTPFGAVKKIGGLVAEIGENNPWDQELNPKKPLDSIISGRIRSRFEKIKASEFLKQITFLNNENSLNEINSQITKEKGKLLNSAILWSFIPGVDNYDLNKKFDIQIKADPNSVNDDYGAIKIKVEAFEKGSDRLVQSKDFLISGFKTEITGIFAYKQRIATAFQNINTLTLKDEKNFNVNKLDSNADIWDFLNLPSNFEKLDINKLRNSDQFDVPESDVSAPNIAKIAKNPYRLRVKNFYYLKATILKNSYDKNTGEIDVILSIYHDSFNNYVSKIVKLKTKANPGFNKLTENKSFKLKEKYANFLPSFLINSHINQSQSLAEFINFGDFNYQNYDIKIVPSLANDQNGDFYIILNKKETSLTSGSISPGQVIKVEGFNSYDKIFSSEEFTREIDFDYLDSWYKLPKTADLAEKLQSISESLNSSSDSLLWPLFGKAVEKALSSEELFKNTNNLKSFEKFNYKFASLVDFKIDETGISFYFGNSLQDYYQVKIKFRQKTESKNIIADFGAKVLEKDSINSSLRARSLVIQLRSNEYDRQTKTNTSKITSGTAWVFDRKLKKDPKNPGKFLPTNTYYLATNLHVIADLLNKPDQVYSFSYLLDGKLKNLDTISFDDTNLFRRFDRVAKTANKKDYLGPEGFQYITRESKKFWENLKINPIGLNMPDKDKFRDFAIIEITFPEDKVKKNSFNFGIPFLDLDFFGQPSYIKNIPDAVKNYQKSPLDFLVTDKLVPNFTKATQEKITDKIKKALPLHAYLGGFLGGFTWITDNKNAFITTNGILKETDFRQENSIKKFQGANSISLPGLRGGHGMSGSLVVNEYNQVLGIFWGGYFPPTLPGQNQLVKGIGQFDPIGLKTDSNPTILAKWLAQTQDIQTDLDARQEKVFSLEDPKELEKLAHSARWIKFDNFIEKENSNI
ncbi:hypothetical protein B5M19_01900 [Mesomycoplasma hyopneumoniae]|uniref:DUF31 domain-containing protein n=3 Tax=Mesomycoplasma hyopneumoniae TaxID=2099 RepID=E4QSH0_MESH1|nr:hypothetical protein [Mesomycoplasma hyopneumoniae]ADQ90381.2 hypothetical protein MHP168_165 [Mesomycoplasma hyopneumoniae 168]AGM21948.1 hypothetical protein MHP168L_165 [Mesomycoplasma hyopneumoniae 168-L]OWY73946.1 hypothetical protein B5M19_01900 [Mesomycoplasma hyopneumoniae]